MPRDSSPTPCEEAISEPTFISNLNHSYSCSRSKYNSKSSYYRGHGYSNSLFTPAGAHLISNTLDHLRPDTLSWVMPGLGIATRRRPT